MTPSDATEYCVVQTTLDSENLAEELARYIVRDRLGACVQMQTVRSFYVWEGRTEATREFLLSIKTRTALYPALADFIREHHPYDTPEIVQLPITDGAPSYLAWVDASTKAPA